MAFHPIPNVARLTCRMEGPQLQVISWGTYWTLETPAPFTHTELDGLASNADVNYWSMVVNGLNPPGMRYVGFEARALDTASSPVAFHGENAANGGHDVTMLPLEVAAIWSLRSTSAGRSHRNRVYWPGLVTSYLDASPNDGILTTAFVALLLGQLQAWAAAVAGAGTFVQVVASPKLGTFDTMAASHVSRRPASQRRREP